MEPGCIILCRAIVNTLTVEELNKWRKKCAESVQEVAGKDLFKLGIEVISFTLKDITDEEDYLTSLGRLSIAAATRDAAIGVAEENRDIAIKTVECRRETKVVQIRSRAAIEAMVRDANMKAAGFHQETQRGEHCIMYNV